MKVVIFCGGIPLQLTAEGQPVPKPMVRLGLRPVLWHVMRLHADRGLKDFVLALGRGADVIKQYFLTYDEALTNDFVLSGADREVTLLSTDIQSWRITFADTGKQAAVLQRLRAVRPLVADDEMFCAAYGDVLTDAPLDEYVADFQGRSELAAVVAVRPPAGPWVVSTDADGLVSDVTALGRSGARISGGYFVFRREIFDVLGDEDSMLDGLLPALAAKRQLRAYDHDGFWSDCDSLRDVQALSAMVESGSAPWLAA